MNFSNDFIIVCPLCGFSFKIANPNKRKKVKKCPMCGYKFENNHDVPKPPDHINRRIF